MLFPLSWLKEFIELPESPETVAEIFNEIGLEVDGFEKAPLKFSGVVVGKVEEAGKHPEADNLKLTKVFDGTEHHQVICGDPSCKEGMHVAFARSGAILEDSDGKTFKIKKTKLRGVESYGMLCSEEELGLAETSDGIMSLSETLKPGTVLADLFDDTIFEISLTPNLAHCFCLLGIAKELSAYLKRPLKDTAFPKGALPSNKASPFKIVVHDDKACPSYSATFIEGVRIEPSPLHIKQKLLACGVRPINNVVDITNLCMMAYGQPLHAFDADKLGGKEIHIRFSESKEKCRTLDGTDRELDKKILVIADDKSPIAIAGVMGGESTEVSQDTKNILLESAHFHPSTVRYGSSKLGISSESSKRFERGVDPKLPIDVAHLASKMILEVSGGSAYDTVSENSPAKKATSIECLWSDVTKLIGVSIPKEEALSTLSFLECEVKDHGDTFTVIPPSHRFDLAIKEDVIEEIVRFYGYSKLPKEAAKYHAGALDHDPMYLFEKKVRSSLLLNGLQEILNIDLVSEAEAIPVINLPHHVSFPKLANPGSSDQSALRSSLLGGVLSTLKRNLSFQESNLQSYEIGKVYYKSENKDVYEEKTHLAITLSGEKHAKYWAQTSSEPWNFFDLKGILENLFTKLHAKDISMTSSSHKAFHPGQSAIIMHDDIQIGFIGKLHPKLTHSWDLDPNVFYCELTLDTLKNFQAPSESFKPLALFPASDRDWTVTVKKSVEAGSLLKNLKSVQHKLLESVELISVFEHEKLGNDRKNLTFRFTYRDTKKTLSLESVEKTHAFIVQQAEKSLAGSIVS